jgi:hypothetical protein
MGKPLLRQLATMRLLDPSPAAVERLDASICAALGIDDYAQALRLVRYRQRVGNGKDKTQFDRQADLLEWAIAHPERMTR